jgi:antitoxin HicB
MATIKNHSGVEFGNQSNDGTSIMKFYPKHVVSSLEDALAEFGILEDVTNYAVKSVLVWKFEQAVKKKKLSKVKMAEAMNTSRAQLDRLLDPKSGNVTLATMQKAANAVGKSLRVELV